MEIEENCEKSSPIVTTRFVLVIFFDIGKIVQLWNLLLLFRLVSADK